MKEIMLLKSREKFLLIMWDMQDTQIGSFPVLIPRSDNIWERKTARFRNNVACNRKKGGGLVMN